MSLHDTDDYDHSGCYHGDAKCVDCKEDLAGTNGGYDTPSGKACFQCLLIRYGKLAWPEPCPQTATVLDELVSLLKEPHPECFDKDLDEYVCVVGIQDRKGFLKERGAL